MALALTGKITLSVVLQATNAQDLSTPVDALTFSHSRTIASGTGDDQADLLWTDQRSLADGATETLAFNDGSLSGAFGAVTFDEVKAIVIRNHSTEAGLLIGGAAATQIGLFSDTSDVIVLPPGTAEEPSCFVWESPAEGGLDVTTNDSLKLAHDGTGTAALTYDIIVMGVDATP